VIVLKGQLSTGQNSKGRARTGALSCTPLAITPFRPLLHEYVLSDRALDRDIPRPDATGHLVADQESGRADHTQQLWTLINLELWQRLYVGGKAGMLDAGSARAAAAPGAGRKEDPAPRARREPSEHGCPNRIGPQRQFAIHRPLRVPT
jgi:hypothetical protein